MQGTYKLIAKFLILIPNSNNLGVCKLSLVKKSVKIITYRRLKKSVKIVIQKILQHFAGVCMKLLLCHRNMEKQVPFWTYLGPVDLLNFLSCGNSACVRCSNSYWFDETRVFSLFTTLEGHGRWYLGSAEPVQSWFSREIHFKGLQTCVEDGLEHIL